MRKSWKNLTKREKNEKVAVLADWEKGPEKDLPCGPWTLNAMTLWHKKSDGPGSGWQDDPPDFMEDLNAMNKAEQMFNRQSDTGYDWWSHYSRNLRKVIGCEGYIHLITASAADRAEAFVMTMEKTGD